MWSSLLLPTVLLSGTCVLASSVYAPQQENCPSTAILRAANGLSDEEETYRVARKAVADVALKSWLTKTDSSFGTGNMPTIAMTTSGGGYRSLLSGAGVIQAFDARDSNGSTSGLYQAMTYQAGLSGGGWLLSSLAGNNYPTISSLKQSLWHVAFRDSLIDPNGLLALKSFVDIANDIKAKEAAGFDVTLVDPYGRLLSYQLLEGSDGGAATTLSSVTGFSNFTSFAVPYPIITALGAKVFLGECAPGPNGTTYEFSPFEFGSWDSDVSAFVQTHFLGTALSGGKPTGLCTTNYDNLGYILGTSSNLFNEACLSVPSDEDLGTGIATNLISVIDKIHEVGTSDLYATYPNPFFNFVSSTAVSNSANNISAQANLSLADGGEAAQNNPIFPFLQPARNVSVIVVNDNSAHTFNNFPNGSQILTTFVQSFNHDLTLMPFIPSVDTFLSQGLNTRATFFGCNATDKITIVYLPNFHFSFASNVSTAQLAYSEDEQDQMVLNGNMIAEQGNKEGWATCLGCAIMMKTGEALPGACGKCFEEYCFYGNGTGTGT